MSKVIVHKADSGKAAVSNPFFGRIEEALGAVRNRAYELFEKRGCAPGGEMDDWLQAEKDLFLIPDAEITEDGRAFRAKITAPGFESDDVDVIALPRELLIQAKAAKQNGESSESKCFYRRFEFADPIDIDKVKATLDKGQLTIEAPRKTATPITVRAAAA